MYDDGRPTIPIAVIAIAVYLMLMVLAVTSDAVPDCTAPSVGTVELGPVDEFTSGLYECEEGGDPASTDWIDVPNTVTVRQVLDVDFTADGAAITVRYGGEYWMDVPTDGGGNALNLKFWAGQDEEPAAEGDVALYTAPGSKFYGLGGYLTRSLDQPLVRTSVSHALGNVWIADGVAPCGTGTDDEAGYIGGNTGGSCAAGNEEYNWTLVYTTERNNPGAANEDTTWDFPAGTDTTIVCAVAGGTPNTANCNNVVGGLTDVGSYTAASSPFGTFDQGGNVWEWLETIDDANRYTRGGSYSVPAGNADEVIRSSVVATSEAGIRGFRVAAPYGTEDYVAWTPVGAPAMSENPYGEVDYSYLIGTYEVTNTEYTELLNAVAATDTNVLYNTSMGSGEGGIDRSGAPGSYTYAVAGGEGDRPVNFVSFWDATRFANWLHNDKPSGAQSTATTEDGAYTLAAGCDLDNTCTRNAAALVWVTSEDEWYKAAYYEAGDDNNLDESLSAVATDFLVVYRTGAEAGHAYVVSIVDHGADQFGLTLDTRQLAPLYTNDNEAFPLTWRAIVAGSSYNPSTSGDVCVESNEDLLATLGHGGYVGAYLRGCPTIDGTECDTNVRKISASVDDTDCSGGVATGRASFWFEEPLAGDYPDNWDFTIEPLGVEPGDEFHLLIPARIWIANERVDGEGKLVFKGDVTLRGVQLCGMGEVWFDGANATISDTHTCACGIDGAPCMKFHNMQRIDMASSSFVGGPELEDSGHVEIQNLLGRAHFQRVVSRYYGDDAWSVTGTASTGRGYFYDITCERKGIGDGIRTIDCFEVDDDAWLGGWIYDLFTTDPIQQEVGHILKSETHPLVVNGLFIFGLAGVLGGGGEGGGITREGVGDQVYTSNVWGRRVYSLRLSAVTNSFTGSYTSGCDFRDSTFEVGNGASWNSDATPVTVEYCYFENTSIDEEKFIHANDATGSARVRGNVFANTTTTATDANSSVIMIALDGDPATQVEVVENAIVWDEGETTGFDHGIGSDEGAQDDTVILGGNLVDGLVTIDAGVTAALFGVPAPVLVFTTVPDGMNNCAGRGDATDGGATFERVENHGGYPVRPLMMGPMRRADADGGRQDAPRDTWSDELNCGARSGHGGAGIGPGHSWGWMKAGLPEPKPSFKGTARRGR